MCGFVSLFQPGKTFPEKLLSDMEADIFHRGPDSGGRRSEEGWSLVFRRLSIMDPQNISDQPMDDPEGRCSLVFNGEIYNFHELRKKLEAKGARFRTKSDTEVILQGYLHWGEAVFQKLEGMFAVTLVDHRAGKAWIARDPLGIKPLYMLRKGDLTAFASEVRPLLRLHPARADLKALGELLMFGWAAGRLSNYDGIERIPGGTLIEIDLQNAEMKERRFCDPLETLVCNQEIDEAEIFSAVEESLKAHLMSDVGYALQLSGGVDSSLIAALAVQNSKTKLKSYSANPRGYVHDEAQYQDQVVQKYSLDHHAINIDGRIYADALPDAITAMEGPTPHGGCVALMLLCRKIAQSDKVVLTGEGADEMFGGYFRYGQWQRLCWQERFAQLLPTGLVPDIRPFRGIHRLGKEDGAVYASLYRDTGPTCALFPSLLPARGARERTSRGFKDFRSRLFAVDQTAYLESLLVRQDKMSMAASVEARVPYVHLPLLRLLNTLAHAQRAPGGTTKPLLKKMAEKFLPHSLVHRRKVGLLLPYEEWYSDPQGAGRYLDLLGASDGRLAAYSRDPKAFGQMIDDFRKGRLKEKFDIRKLAETELWLRSLESAPVPDAA